MMILWRPRRLRRMLLRMVRGIGVVNLPLDPHEDEPLCVFREYVRNRTDRLRKVGRQKVTDLVEIIEIIKIVEVRIPPDNLLCWSLVFRRVLRLIMPSRFEFRISKNIIRAVSIFWQMNPPPL